MNLLLAILLAFLLVTFVLKPLAYRKLKCLRCHRYFESFSHSAIYAFFASLFALFITTLHAVEITKLFLFVFASHLILDFLIYKFSGLIKLRCAHSKNDAFPGIELGYFLTFNACNLAAIIFISSYFTQLSVLDIFDRQLISHIFLLFIALILLFPVSSQLISIILKNWEISPHLNDGDTSTFLSTSKMIGFIERSFVFGFVITNNITAIGFVLTAESILRYNKIKNTSVEKYLSEYIIIGTFLSFGFAILIGYGYLTLLNHLTSAKP